MRFAHSRRWSAGFTFAEITVAVLILVIGMLPVYSLIESQSRRARYSKIRAFGAGLAANFLERLRGCSLQFLLSEPPAGGGTAPAGSGPRTLDAAIPIGGGGGAIPLYADDTIWNPAADPNIPQDEEMKSLLEEWRKRANKFNVLPLFPKRERNPDLGARNTVLIGVKVSWGRRKDTTPLPEELTDLDLGPEHLSLACFAGESLFHPPPKVNSGGGPP